jgi:hypothetical protein
LGGDSDRNRREEISITQARKEMRLDSFDGKSKYESGCFSWLLMKTVEGLGAVGSGPEGLGAGYVNSFLVFFF